MLVLHDDLVTLVGQDSFMHVHMYRMRLRYTIQLWSERGAHAYLSLGESLSRLYLIRNPPRTIEKM